MFNIVLKDLRIIMKDKKALMIMVAMPLILMFILGNALGFMFEDEINVDRFKVGIVDRDGDIFADILIGDVFKENERYFELIVMEEGDIKAALDTGEIVVAVVIPEDFSDHIMNQIEDQIKIYADGFDQIETQLVYGYLEGFSQNISILFSGTKARLTTYSVINEDWDGIEEIPAKLEAQDVMTDLMIGLGERGIIFNDLEDVSHSKLTGLNYYAATILIMFILFGASFGAELIIEERELNTLQRVLSTGVNQSVLILGKFFSLCAITLTQAVFLILFSRFVYQVHWGPSTFGLLVLVICSVLSGSSIGMLIACVARTQNGGSALAQLIIQSFNILGGGMIPLRLMPEFIQNAGNVTINFWAIRGFHNLMMGYGFERIILPCLVMLGMGVIYLGFAILRFRVE